MTSAALTFPLTQHAAEALGKFQSGNNDLLVMSIVGETVELQATQQAASFAELCSVLPAKSPCYCMYRWKHVREGADVAPVVFVYCCPEESPVRAK